MGHGQCLGAEAGPEGGPSLSHGHTQGDVEVSKRGGGGNGGLQSVECHLGMTLMNVYLDIQNNYILSCLKTYNIFVF